MVGNDDGQLDATIRTHTEKITAVQKKRMKNAPDTRYVYTHKHTWCVHGRTPRDGEGRLGWRQIRTVRLNEPKRDDSLAHSFPFLFICWLCACSITCNDCTFSWFFSVRSSNCVSFVWFLFKRRGGKRSEI